MLQPKTTCRRHFCTRPLKSATQVQCWEHLGYTAAANEPATDCQAKSLTTNPTPLTLGPDTTRAPLHVVWRKQTWETCAILLFTTLRHTSAQGVAPYSAAALKMREAKGQQKVWDKPKCLMQACCAFQWGECCNILQVGNWHDTGEAYDKRKAWHITAT